MKRILQLMLALAGTTFVSQAAIYSTNWSSGFVNGTTVPDGSYSGWTDTRTVNTMPAGTLNGVAVDLNLNSGWTGDLYAYLQSGSGFVVLLDLVGGGSYGPASNLDVTLAAGSSWGVNSIGGNIYSYGGGATSGTYWNPDNNNAGITLTANSGTLGSFTVANATWTLFIADLSGGGVTTVADWGLQMDITAVPEPATWAGMIFGGGLAVWYGLRTQAVRRRMRCWRGAVNEWLDAA
jgi:subtilisin-like proprotein convertase family protein